MEEYQPVTELGQAIHRAQLALQALIKLHSDIREHQIKLDKLIKELDS